VARHRPADHLSAQVLTRPDFIEASAQRDLGEVLRLAKQWGGVGFSSSHLARRCEMTVSRVQDYVNGRIQAQRVEVFERVADGLHIPGALFNLAPRPWEITRQGADAPVVATNELNSSENGDSSVLRRDFVKLGAGLAATALTGSRTGMPSPVSGTRIGSSTLAELRAKFGRLRSLDDHLGGAETYRLYAGELQRTGGILKSNSFPMEIRRELLTLFAEQAQQAGWAAFDAGWQPKASKLYETSYNAATQAGEVDLAGNALAYSAYQAVSGGLDGTKASDGSCEVAARTEHPAVQSLLYQRAAWTYAMAGNAQRTGEVLGLAEEALTKPVGGVPAPAWAAWAHNAVELQIMAGRCWTVLRRPLRAMPALEAAMAQYDDSHSRDKALYLSWLADAYIDAGEIERAVQVTERALDLSTDVASSRPTERLGLVLDRFAPYASESGVSDLLARRPLDPLQVRS
jgi:tetratricopeptide (TPR) repeat protein